MRLRHTENGATLALEEGQVYHVGRHQLGVTDKRVSRHQLQLSLRGPDLAITVEGVNPVYVRRAGTQERELLARGEEAILRPGDVVTLLAEQHPLVFEEGGHGDSQHAPTTTPVPQATQGDRMNKVAATEREEKEALAKKRKFPFTDGVACNNASHADDLDDGIEGNDQEPRVKRTMRLPPSANSRIMTEEEVLEKRKREQREEAETDEAAARKSMQEAYRAMKRARAESGHHEKSQPRRRSGRRHAARAAKEKMEEYLELVGQAAAEKRALDEDDRDESDNGSNHVPDSDAFDAAEWKRNADDVSEDEENVSEGSSNDNQSSDQEGYVAGPQGKPACKYGSA